MILVTGAAGKTGTALVRALAVRGAAVRALVRSPEQLAALQASGATETVIGDLRNDEEVRRACQAIDTIYLICPNMQPDEVVMAEQVIAAAKRTSVTRLVYHSVLHPQTETMPHHWQKLRVEASLFKSGFDYTIFQPAAYMQNVLAGWSTITNEGIYRAPYAISTVLGMVDLHDVAEAAALVLTTAGHNGATYELAGAEWLTQNAVAAILSEVLGRPVRAEAQARDVWQRNARKSGQGEYAITTLLRMFEYYECYGFYGNAHTLTWLLGRPPTSFADCMRRYAAQGSAYDNIANR